MNTSLPCNLKYCKTMIAYTGHIEISYMSSFILGEWKRCENGESSPCRKSNQKDWTDTCHEAHFHRRWRAFSQNG